MEKLPKDIVWNIIVKSQHKRVDDRKPNEGMADGVLW